MSPFAKAVGMRVFVWGGVALLALALLGDCAVADRSELPAAGGGP